MKIMFLFLIFWTSNACAEVYTWKDNAGTDFYTNSLYDIPAHYLLRAKIIDIATGKKAKLTLLQLQTQNPSTGQGVTKPPPIQQPNTLSVERTIEPKITAVPSVAPVPVIGSTQEVRQAARARRREQRALERQNRPRSSEEE